jgi:hypothetical protein
MWEFPRHELQARESAKKALQRLGHAYQLQVDHVAKLATLHYSVTRFRIAMDCFLLTCSEATHTLGEYVEGRWLLPSELAAYPLSTAQRKLANIVLERLNKTGLETNG